MDGYSIIAQRDTQVADNVSVFYRDRGGFVATRGEGCYIFNPSGQRYLDTCNNVACVGHSHPHVVQQGQAAIAQIQTNQRFLHPVQQQYLAKLLATFPPELDTVYMVTSGSEANDLALRIARAATSAPNPDSAIVLDGAYHGNTSALIDVSPYKWTQAIDGINRKKDFVHVVSCPDPYSGRHIGMTERVGELYAQEVRDVVVSSGGVGCFFAESAMGCVGQVLLPPTYLSHCYAAVREKGGICIADEVQTGFGRCGSHFWMFQHHNVVPDIVTLGKPMGNGYPVSAVVCKRFLADKFASTGIEYFNTFGGNSVACYIAEAVLDVIKRDNLQQNALVIGGYIRRRLLDMQSQYDCIGSVRGCGLFIGVEFVSRRSHSDESSFDSGHRNPDAEVARFIVDDMFESGHVISSRDGHVLKIKPPLIFGMVEADMFLDALDSSLRKRSI